MRGDVEVPLASSGGRGDSPGAISLQEENEACTPIPSRSLAWHPAFCVPIQG